MNFAANPVILIGMHRSGTTMIAKMLRDLGLFIGWSLEPNLESRFFLTINQAILNAYSGNWDNPYPIENLLNHAELREVVTQNLSHDLNSLKILYFLGPKRYIQYRSIQKLDFPWGWKDPRTTFLLPLWLDIFPNAKIIHIYRNGIDVAVSLMNREQRKIKNITSSKYREKLINSQKQQLISDGILLYLLNKIHSRYKKLNPFYRYTNIGVSQCLTVEKGFSLWCDYMSNALKYTENGGIEFLNIGYEDFLLDPETSLREMSNFCGLSYNTNKLMTIVEQVNPQRRFAFFNDPTLSKFYENVKNHPLMRRFGYHEMTNIL